MAADKSALKTQIKSFTGESMNVWKGFDSQRHLSDIETKYDVLSFFVSRIPFAAALYSMPQNSLDTRSFTKEIPHMQQKQAAF